MLQVRTPGFVIDPPTIVGAGGTATEVTVQTELYRTESTNCAAVITVSDSELRVGVGNVWRQPASLPLQQREQH